MSSHKSGNDLKALPLRDTSVHRPLSKQASARSHSGAQRRKPASERHRRERQHTDMPNIGRLAASGAERESRALFSIPSLRSYVRAALVKGRDELATLALDRVRLQDKIYCLYEGMG
jgi:hypothetical protein